MNRIKISTVAAAIAIALLAVVFKMAGTGHELIALAGGMTASSLLAFGVCNLLRPTVPAKQIAGWAALFGVMFFVLFALCG